MLAVHALTPGRWDDFVRLCAQMGSNRTCWCMWWRDDGRPPEKPARERAHALVAASPVPIGVIAYDGDEPVGWAALAPRPEYPRLNRSRTTAPVDASPGVWVVPCFFVVPSHRQQGVSAALLSRAVALAQSHGATIVEGVPGDPATRVRTPGASYTGTLALFRNAGFEEVARRTPKGRVVVRKRLTSTPAKS